MQPVIYPVNKAKLLAELTEERFIRKTNKGGNEIYSFNAFNSPNLMKEVGRLRELTFRTAGGGTGKEVDIDPFDVDEQVPYQQLIVWDPKEQEILGGYRYILCDNLPLNQEGEPNLATTELFRFSEAFKKQYLTKMIELGRSFVQPLYQSTKMGRKSLFALDNLWDGLGALTVENPGMEYFFGKVTMYTSFNIEARDMILFGSTSKIRKDLSSRSLHWKFILMIINLGKYSAEIIMTRIIESSLVTSGNMEKISHP